MGTPLKEGHALVLLSGGVDSCVALALARRDCERAGAISFRYAQKHSKEVLHAADVSQWYSIEHHFVALAPGIFGSESTIVEGGPDQPEMTYEELMKGRGVSPTYVPFRNANFLAVATSMAMTHGYDRLYWAPHATDAHHWAYPDCTPEFAGAMANAIFIGTSHEIRLVTPLQWLTKREVVALGLELGAPLHLTWSCYRGDKTQCGRCPTCIERVDAFRAAGIFDPVAYEIDIDFGRQAREYPIPVRPEG
jgi:7-cyano-7-deazaguanine synthase